MKSGELLLHVMFMFLDPVFAKLTVPRSSDATTWLTRKILNPYYNGPTQSFEHTLRPAGCMSIREADRHLVDLHTKLYSPAYISGPSRRSGLDFKCGTDGERSWWEPSTRLANLAGGCWKSRWTLNRVNITCLSEPKTHV
jgi:hypothetical protein